MATSWPELLQILTKNGIQVLSATIQMGIKPLNMQRLRDIECKKGS
jgi:hypothetical protein